MTDDNEKQNCCKIAISYACSLRNKIPRQTEALTSCKYFEPKEGNAEKCAFADPFVPSFCLRSPAHYEAEETFIRDIKENGVVRYVWGDKGVFKYVLGDKND